MPYVEVSIIGFNANPPSDDGAEVAANEVAWQKHLDKIGDPLKNALEQIDNNVKAFSDESPSGQPGTRMLFQQTAAPTGWTKETTASFNNTALRIVTGTVTSRTTTSAFTTVFGKTATDGHALTIGQLASHTHSSGTLGGTFTSSSQFALNPSSLGQQSGGADSIEDIDTSLVTGSINVTGSTASRGSGSAHSHGMDIRVNYHDVVLATKDA